MEKYKLILFDLDGTLSDPREGITKSIQYALSEMGIVENDRQKLECFIGPPLQVTFAELYDFDVDSVQKVTTFYRKRFTELGMYENKLYPGIPSLLDVLKKQSYKLAVATSKPTVYAEKILQHFNIDYYFDVIVGSNLDGTRISKTEIIHYVMEQNKRFVPEEMVMVGDRKHDIIGANENGIDSIGVTYGYGSYEELIKSKPSRMITSVNELQEIF